MNDNFFIDTNVLVYCRDPASLDKHVRAKKWLDFLWRSRRGVISIQVLTEYYEVVRRRKMATDLAAVEQDIRSLYSWKPLSLGTTEIDRAFAIRSEFACSWWDSLMLSSALSLGSRYFLSEDLQANQVIDKMRILNPFDVSPENIL